MGTAANTIDQEKFDRLKAIAQGGKEGLAQYDASQKSLYNERATMAAGLADESKSAGFHGATKRGAPVALTHQLEAGISPFAQALAADKASFTRNVAQGGIANMRYLDQAKAAIAPTLAAARSGGGGGGGGKGTGNPGNLTDTQLKNALIAEAAKARSSQIESIHASAEAAAAAFTAGKKAQAPGPLPAYFSGGPSQVPTPGGIHVAPTPGSQVPTPGGQHTPGGDFAETQRRAAAAYAAALHARDVSATNNRRVETLRELIPQRAREQQQLSSAPIVPFARQLGQQAGLDPLFLESILTPEVERTYQNALKATLPKVEAQADVKPGPVAFTTAAHRLGLSPEETRRALGLKYDRGVDDKGKANAPGFLAQDIIDNASEAAKRGYDYESFIALLDNDPYLAAAIKRNPKAAKLGGAIAAGFWPEQQQAPATNIYQQYYDRQYPPVSLPGG